MIKLVRFLGIIALSCIGLALSGISWAASRIFDAFPADRPNWRQDPTPRSIFQTRRMGLA